MLNYLHSFLTFQIARVALLSPVYTSQDIDTRVKELKTDQFYLSFSSAVLQWGWKRLALSIDPIGSFGGPPMHYCLYHCIKPVLLSKRPFLKSRDQLECPKRTSVRTSILRPLSHCVSDLPKVRLSMILFSSLRHCFFAG